MVVIIDKGYGAIAAPGSRVGRTIVKLWRTERQPKPWQPFTRERPKAEGLHCADSQFVRRGFLLVTQFGLRFHPGLNVSIEKNCKLFSKEHGRVFFTTEKLKPKVDHTLVSHYYADHIEKNTPIYRTYVHVIPAPMPQTFNLKDQI